MPFVNPAIPRGGRLCGCRFVEFTRILEIHFTGRSDADPVGEHLSLSFPLERLRQAVLRQIWQDTDDLATTDRRLGLLPEFYAEEIGMVFRKNLQ